MFNLQSGAQALRCVQQDLKLVERFNSRDFDKAIDELKKHSTTGTYNYYQSAFLKLKEAYDSGKEVYEEAVFAKQFPEINGVPFDPRNFEAYFTVVRKCHIISERYSVLKRYDYIVNPMMLSNARDEFDAITINELVDEAEKELDRARSLKVFENPLVNSNLKSMQEEFDRHMKEGAHGYPSFSPILDYFVDGFARGESYLIVGCSHSGKTLMAVALAAELSGCTNETGDGAFYMGAEMNYATKIQPRINSYIAGTSIYDYRDRTLSAADLKSYLEAMEIQSMHQINGVVEPDYNVALMKDYLNQSDNKGINAFILDYVIPTTSVSKECGSPEKIDMYQHIMKNLDNYHIAKDYNLATIAFAQATANLDELIHDPHTSCDLPAIGANHIGECHTMYFKAEECFFLLVTTQAHLDLVTERNFRLWDLCKIMYPPFEKLGLLNFRGVDPNRIRRLWIKKNRRGYEQDNVCIWYYVEDGNLRWHDLFATDGNFNLIPFSMRRIYKDKDGILVAEDKEIYRC